MGYLEENKNCCIAKGAPVLLLKDGLERANRGRSFMRLWGFHFPRLMSRAACMMLLSWKVFYFGELFCPDAVWIDWVCLSSRFGCMLVARVRPRVFLVWRRRGWWGGIRAMIKCTRENTDRRAMFLLITGRENTTGRWQMACYADCCASLLCCWCLPLDVFSACLCRTRCFGAGICEGRFSCSGAEIAAHEEGGNQEHYAYTTEEEFHDSSLARKFWSNFRIRR